MVSLIHYPSGVTLFSKIFNKFCENFDDDILKLELIGNFITALKMFSKEFGQDKIKQIEMSTLKFLIYEKSDIMNVFLLDIDDNIENYKKNLIVCLNVFLKMFSRDLQRDFNDLNKFKPFNPILHEILKTPPEKIENSFLDCPIGLKSNCIFTQVQNMLLDYTKSNKILIKR